MAALRCCAQKEKAVFEYLLLLRIKMIKEEKKAES